MERLGLRADATRADIAPQLNQINDETGSKWKWNKDGSVTMNHFKCRYELFTPLRVSGAPPAKALTAIRVTEGEFVDGQRFRRRDHWTTRSTAHLRLAQPWTGTTTFFLKSTNEIERF